MVRSTLNARTALGLTGVMIAGIAAGVMSLTDALGEGESVAVPDYRRVLLEADFDDLSRGQLSVPLFRAAFGDGSLVPEVYDDSTIEAGPGGRGNVYRVTLEAGSFQLSPPGNNGIVTFVTLGESVEKACVSYDVRFSDGFDWSLGGKLPGLQGTLAGVEASLPTGGGNPGELGWSARGMWLGPGAYAWAGPVNMAVSYVYGPRQEQHYGDNEPWGRGFEAGRWHRVVQCHIMNSAGRADGTLQAWMDDDLVLDIDDHVYRLRDDLGITHLNWSVFRGGDSIAWAGDRTGYVEFDNVRVTTE